MEETRMEEEMIVFLIHPSMIMRGGVWEGDWRRYAEVEHSWLM
jgi:hypothetical protein